MHLLQAAERSPTGDAIVHMLYNSDSYVVVRFEVDGTTADDDRVGDAVSPSAPVGRGGYEIVDKFAGREIYLQGTMAAQFREGVDALVRQGPSEEAVDAYLERFTLLMQQPVVLH